MPDRYLLTKS